MRIGIIGAGNIGTAIAGDIGRKHEVRVYSSKPYEFAREIRYIDDLTEDVVISPIHLVSDDIKEVVSGCKVVFVCVPTFMIKSVVDKMCAYINDETYVGFVPGAGGVEYAAKSIIECGITVFGFERVPYIARLEEYGVTVRASKKDRYRIASLPKDKSKPVCEMVEFLFARPCEYMNEFIALTLTPSLHVSRCYELYKDWKPGERLSDNTFFYGDWTDDASVLTFELDSELHLVCECLTKIGVSATEVVPYSIHYGSGTPKELTKKLRSIRSLRNIKGPVHHKEGLGLNLSSRYFTESFPYRLCMVKAFADILQIKTPKTDEVLLWYQELCGKEYLNKSSFCGKDINECNVPQNYGIVTREKLVNYYSIIQNR